MPDGGTLLLNIDLPYKLGFLMEPHPYKVVYSGRFGMKTRSCTKALLALGAKRRLRILCCRQFMNSIKDSLHQELKEQIEEQGLGGFYTVLDNEIRGANGTVFIFAGLHGHSALSIKSYANIDIALVEEAEAVTSESWTLLIPTIRKDGSEIWVIFNPGMENADTWQRWVVTPPPGAIVVKTNWRDAQELGWFPEAENQKRLHHQRTRPHDYDNVWEGVPTTIVAGAIYRVEMAEMVNSGRIRAIPYDPRVPVHTVWDLGWNDMMVVIMVQKPVPTVVNVINYYEDNFRRYDEVVALLDKLAYRWGEDWLPHDGGNHNPQLGESPQKTLQRLGRRRVKIIGGGKRPDPDIGIGMVRMMFPRVYIDNSTREHPTGFLGAQRLIDCLRRTARNVPRTTGEPAEQKRDEYKHGADAFRGLATIVDQIRNDHEWQKAPTVAAFRPSDATLGNLG